MSKLSVRPDTNNAPPLKPTQFPFPNILNFKISETSSENNSRSQYYQEPDEVNFMTTPQTLPNLFQYNDRSKLILSSDQENEQSQSSKEGRKEAPKSLSISVTKEDHKNGIGEQEVLSPKFNVETEKKIFPITDQPQVKTNVKQVRKQSQVVREDSQMDVKQEKKNENNEKMKLASQQEKKIKKDQIIIEEDISRTDVILQKIQTEQRNVILQTEPNEALNESKTIPLTPTRKRRNKIFDQSAKRDLSYLSSSRKNQTPNKEAQTQSRYMRKDRMECSRSRVQNTPQVKALNILDKLVDQIGTDKYSCSNSKHFCQSDQNSSNMFLYLSEFNKMSLQEIFKIESISDISMISSPAFQSRIHNLHDDVQRWKEKVAKSVVDIPFTNSVQYEIIKRFEKICENVNALYNMSIGYKQTAERLSYLQGRLEEYVNILQDQDTKRLYVLVSELNYEIDRMKQIKVKGGNYILEKMFCQYLRKQILLLEEIKGDIQNNFMNDYPLLTF